MITTRARVVGIDLARALAIYGMVLINFNAPMGGEESGPVWLKVAIEAVEGRAAALFVILSGVGLSLLSRNARATQDPGEMGKVRRKVIKRCLFLFAVGLSYTEFWPPDILHFYSAYLVVGLFFAARPDRELPIGALFFIFISALLMYVFDYSTGWDFENMEYSDLWSLPGMVRHIFFNGYFPVFPWTAFLLAGMWLGRQDLRSAAFRKRVFAAALWVFVISESVSTLSLDLFDRPEVWSALPGLDYYLATTPYPPSVFFVFSAGATGFIAAMATLTLAERFGEARWMEPMVSTGRMALTIYIGHVLLGLGALDLAELMVENQPLFFILFSAAAFNVVATILSFAWETYLGTGPLERVMRRISQAS